MDFLEVIEKRHSVRRFTDEPVDRELLDAIIGIAQTAPSSKNCHSSAFMVIEDKDTLLAVSEMRDRGSAFLKGAPAAIVVMGDRSRCDIWVENASISATFIQLAATALDLGSCWVHVRDRQRSSADPSKGTAEDYLRGVDERRRLLNAESELFRRRLAETEDQAARAAVEAEMNTRLAELIRDYRGFQGEGFEAARAAAFKVEAYRDELAGPAGNPFRTSASADPK